MGIPDPTMAKLVEWATDAGLAVSDRGKFKKTLKVLWSRFEANALPAVVVRPDEVLKAAYHRTGKKNRQLGDLIVKNLASHDDQGNHADTNRCASDCGVFARTRALEKFPFEIDVDTVKGAANDTEYKMGKLLKRARRIAKKQGRKLRNGDKGNGC